MQLKEILSTTLKSPVFRWGFFLLCLSTVLYGNFRTAPPAQVFTDSDKVGHAVSFLFLGISANLAMYKVRASVLWVTLATAAFLLEYLQGALRPLRTFSIEDGYANFLGVLAAILVMLVWSKFAPQSLLFDDQRSA